MKNLKATLVTIALSVFAGMTISGCQDEGLEPSEPGLLVPGTVDDNPSLPQLAINGTNLHVETYGDQKDPLLVVLHGGPGGDYRSLLKCKAFAADGFFVIFYDQRGSGLSRRHSKSTFTLDVMIEDLDAIIQHFRTFDQKVFLLGQSWGAMLATAYINRHPADIAGAILSEPGGFSWDVTKDYLSRSRETKLLSEGTSDVFYFDQVLTGKEDQHAILDYKFALLTAHDNVKGNPIGNAGANPFWRYGAAAQAGLFERAEKDGFDFTANLHQYSTPVLFLYSELNTAYGPAHASKVSAAYPNAQLVMIKGSGHEIPSFGWENYYPVASQYLNTLK